MNFQEQELYHEIHPLKLLTDLNAGLIALYLLWLHQIFLALVIAFVPSILASFIIIRIEDLEWIRNSSAGHYVERYMSNSVRMIRLVGYLVMMIGTWYHQLYLIPVIPDS